MNRREFVVAVAATPLVGACAHGPPVIQAKTPQRSVSIAPAMTEALFALGAGHRLVGRTRYCDFPPEALAAPVVGGMVDPDLEVIVQLSPDLVVGVQGPASDRLEDRLRARGLPVWVPRLDSIADIESMILGFGARLDQPGPAARVTRNIEADLDAVARAVATLPMPRVLVVLSTAPVVAAGPTSYIGELLERSRAANVLGDGGPWQKLDLERVIELDPDALLDASTDPAAGSRIGAGVSAWRQVRAVSAGWVVAVGDSRVLRPGPRVAEGLAVLARAIHPGAAPPRL
jgi:iron complex transport system substrate-binding protein